PEALARFDRDGIGPAGRRQEHLGGLGLAARDGLFSSLATPAQIVRHLLLRQSRRRGQRGAAQSGLSQKLSLVHRCLPFFDGRSGSRLTPCASCFDKLSMRKFVTSPHPEPVEG